MYRWLCLFAVAASAVAQRSFDVASVKPESLKVGAAGFVGIRITGNKLHAETQPLAGLVQYAYGMQDFQVVGGPAWVHSRDLYGSDTYEVLAQAAIAAPTEQQFREMLQTLLEDRFKLRVHRETKDFPAYDLTLGKNGNKLKLPEDPKAQTMWNSGKVSRYHGKNVSMETLLFLLRTQTGRPVLDKTGLTGKWDFELEWAEGNPPPPDVDAPSVFTAVQEQLGLKLDSVKAPFEILVIDSAERPTEN